MSTRQIKRVRFLPSRARRVHPARVAFNGCPSCGMRAHASRTAALHLRRIGRRRTTGPTRDQGRRGGDRRDRRAPWAVPAPKRRATTSAVHRFGTSEVVAIGVTAASTGRLSRPWHPSRSGNGVDRRLVLRPLLHGPYLERHARSRLQLAVWDDHCRYTRQPPSEGLQRDTVIRVGAGDVAFLTAAFVCRSGPGFSGPSGPSGPELIRQS